MICANCDTANDILDEVIGSCRACNEDLWAGFTDKELGFDD